MNAQTSPSVIKRYGFYFAWLVSLAAVGGSLYFSEIAGFVPCTLCWVQRIFMYPLVVILGIACFREDRIISIYVLPLSMIGGMVSIYHYIEQKAGGLPSPCLQGVPCSVEYINWFEFVTIPFLALIGFLLISLFLWFGRKTSSEEDES
jgi:disulfide bond formation protein DsbB